MPETSEALVAAFLTLILDKNRMDFLEAHASACSIDVPGLETGLICRGRTFRESIDLLRSELAKETKA